MFFKKNNSKIYQKNSVIIIIYFFYKGFLSENNFDNLLKQTFKLYFLI